MCADRDLERCVRENRVIEWRGSHRCADEGARTKMMSTMSRRRMKGIRKGFVVLVEMYDWRCTFVVIVSDDLLCCLNDD